MTPEIRSRGGSRDRGTGIIPGAALDVPRLHGFGQPPDRLGNLGTESASSPGSLDELRT
jgi:hypothetical protein